MLVNHKDKIVYLALPKTGSTSVEELILNVSKKFERNMLRYNGENIPVQKHISLNEIITLYGSVYKDYKFLAVIRSPLDLISSKYYHYRNGRGYQRLRSREKFSLVHIIKVLSANLLPLGIWSIVYPLRLNFKYIETKGKYSILLNVITFEALLSQPNSLTGLLQLEMQSIEMPRSNINMKRPENKFCVPMFEKYLRRKFKREFIFYETIREHELNSKATPTYSTSDIRKFISNEKEL